MQPSANALLETDLLQTFVAISETGSFTAAAKRILRTPSAVSMQVKKLEDQLGRPLFVRHARHVTLTHDGEAFLMSARDMLRLNREALQRFRKPLLEGRVRFGVPDDFGTRVLPNILCRFAHSNPAVDVDVTLSSSKHLTRQLEQGEIDLVLIISTQAEPGPGTPIHSEPLVWVGRRNGCAHTRDPVPVAMSAPGCAWRAAALRELDAASRAYRIAYTSETGAGQLAAVEADLAIAPIPVSLVTPPFAVLGTGEGFPPIGPYELRLLEATNPSSAAEALATQVRASFAEQAATNLYTGSGDTLLSIPDDAA